MAALALAQAALSGAAADSCWSLSDGEVVAALGAALSVRSGTEAVTASLVGQAESRGVRTQLAQASTAGWLRRRFQLSSREAHRLTGLAEVLPRIRSVLGKGSAAHRGGNGEGEDGRRAWSHAGREGGRLGRGDFTSSGR